MMKTVWFKNCKSAEDREEVRKLVKSSAVLTLMRELLEDDLRDLERKEITPDYTSPAWSHLQAHRNGDKYRLKQVLELLNLEKEDQS